MWTEHSLPMLVDLLFLAVAGAVWTLAAGPLSGGSVVAVLGLTVLFHLAQVWWLVVDRFDDSGVTIVRPWRRRHVPWARIGGLVHTRGSDAGARAPYRLRLVLADNEPPVGRYLTPAERQRYATGPVLMSTYDVSPDPDGEGDRRARRCAERIYAELERHGFPRPEPRTLDFRLPRYTPEEVTRAAAIGLLKLHPVTVTHGPLDADGTRLLDTELPGLAGEAGPVREVHREPGYAIFSFEDADAAAAFRTAARRIAPAAWSIAAGALPAPKTS